MKKKILLTSFLTIAMCVSLIVGSTYALFTSKSAVNVAITSGKVDVVATIDKESVEKGSTLGSMLDETSIAVSEDSNTITLQNIVPGDYVNFNLVVKNNSNVSINYRVVFSMIEDDGLFEGLTIKIGEEEYDGSSKFSEWTLVQPGSEIVTVPVSISLPESAGNKYQAKSCQLAYIVEAVQGNAKIYNGIAKIGETTYDSIQDALDAAKRGDVVEILNPGVYAPVTMRNEGVTLKGFIGATKSASTVIQTTAINEIKMYANNTTVDSVWVEVVGEKPAWAANWANQVGVFDAYIDFLATGKVAENLTITNCRIYGNGAVDYAILFCNENITFTNNYVEGFKVAVCSMCDGRCAESYVITGNTVKDVEALVNGYWGKVYTGNSANITISNNTALDSTYIALWDYAQTVGRNASAINAEIKGNKNAVLKLTETNKGGETIVDTDAAEVIYQHYVNLKNFKEGNYQVLKADGTENDNYGDSKKFEVKAAGTSKVLLTVGGEYKLMTGNVVYIVRVEENTCEFDGDTEKPATLVESFDDFSEKIQSGEK